MPGQKVVLQAEKVEVTAEQTGNKSDGVVVKGLALPFDAVSRNGVQYEKESVKEVAEQLKGRTMLFNHREDFATGHITDVSVTETGLFFEGNLNPNAEMPNGVTVAEAVERGDISTVSIQAFVEPMDEPADEDGVVDDMETQKVKVRDFLEISPVTIPGFQETSAMPEHLREQGVVPITEAVGPGVTNENGGEEDVAKEPFAGYDDFDACVTDNQDKSDPEAYCAAIKRRVEDREEDAMSDEQDNGVQESDETEEAVGDVAGNDILEFAASHFEGLDVADFSGMVEDMDGEYVGELDLREAAALVADRLDVEPGSVLEALDNAAEESEEADMDEPEDDDEDDGDMDESELVEKIEELEERLDSIVENDAAESQQEGPETGDDLNRLPRFY